MSSLAVASPVCTTSRITCQPHLKGAAGAHLLLPAPSVWERHVLPSRLASPRPKSRTMALPLAAHPLRQVGGHLANLHEAVIAPLKQTAPSREFIAAMLSFTAYNLCRNPTLSQAMTSAGFILWPHLVERVCAKRPLLRELGLQAFNLVIVRGNPCGVFLALAACYAAHQITPHLPKQTHQGARTIAFWGALVGGARFNGRFVK